MTRVLDCTLRDGGYYNNWDFGDATVAAYLDCVSRLPVDVVEIGYCNHALSGYAGRFYYLTLPDLMAIRDRLSPLQKLAIMLNAKDCSPGKIASLLDGLQDAVQIVRLAVDPGNLAAGADLARAVHELGFNVGFNMMYLSKWWEAPSEIGDLTSLRGCVDVLAAVDSFGACTPDQVATATRTLRTLLPDIALGFHGHDNLSMAFANTLAAIDAGASIVDGTFVGMGRGAGNLRTEMILVYLASVEGDALDYDSLSMVVEHFEDLQRQYGWGTNLPYMISGAAKLPQRDVMNWLGKNRYSVASILRALQQQRTRTVDEIDFPPLRFDSVGLNGRSEVMIVGGGPSVGQHALAISRYVARSSTAVIHATTRHLDRAGEFGEKQFLCLAGQGALRLQDGFPQQISAFFVPTPPRFMGSVPSALPKPAMQVSPFRPGQNGPALGPVSDTGPLALALAAARDLDATRIVLVGFDGYDSASSAQQELAQEVQASLDAFRAAHPDIVVESLTPTLYAVPQASIYARLVA